MAAAIPFLLLAGTATQMIGQVEEGEAAKRAGDYNANVARQNSILARREAEANEMSFRAHSVKMLGKSRAAYAASGVTLEGSPLDVLTESAQNAEIDALRIRYGGAQKAASYEASARLYEMGGNAAQVQGYISASSSLLKGTSNAAEKGYI